MSYVVTFVKRVCPLKPKTMKTILAPIDYSDISDNALQYAVELAKFSDAKLILLHIYHLPVPTVEIPITVMVPKEIQNENEKKIKSLEKKIGTQSGTNIKVESIVRSGLIVDEIMNVIKENEIDLVVMGIIGAGKVSERLIGSHTTSLIKRTQTPVLVVPKDARYKEVKKIVLAYDYKNVVNVAAVERFKKFAKIFNAKVLVLDVEKPVEMPVYEHTVAAETLENSLEDVEHVMFFSSAEDLPDEINSFADSHNCDWVAMIPHKHVFLSRLFQESNTKKMAFHTHIPLLSIHD